MFLRLVVFRPRKGPNGGVWLNKLEVRKSLGESIVLIVNGKSLNVDVLVKVNVSSVEAQDLLFLTFHV